MKSGHNPIRSYTEFGYVPPDIVKNGFRRKLWGRLQEGNFQKALFFAVKYGSVDTIRLLLEAGANPYHRDNIKQTCLRFNEQNKFFIVITKNLVTHNTFLFGA